MENNGKEGKITETPSATPEKSGITDGDMESLSEQIEQAIDEMDSDTGDNAPADDSQEAVTVAEDEEEPKADDDNQEETPASGIEDALVERAVKAGISLADAKSFTSNEVLERIVASIEAKAPKPDAPNGDEDNAAKGEGHDVSDLPPELSEDDGYDPGIVSAFNSMRSMLQKQSELIAKLSNENWEEKSNSIFGSLIDTLDESTRKGLDDSARGKLREQFEVLAAGYQSRGSKKTIKEVFDEAVKLSVGDIVAKAKADEKAVALQKRKSLALAKPGGESGARGNPRSDDDGMSELVDILNQKFM
jgi:hypothetical protein